MSAFGLGTTTRLADTGFLALDRVELLDRGTVHERVVVRHPGAVVIAAVEPDGRAVCVRQYRVATGGALLEVPAGKRDHHGEPPEETAARELAEELGLRAGRLVALAEFWNSPGFCDEYSYVFLATDLTPVGAPEPTSPEEREMTVERVALDELEDRIARREIVDAKTMVALLLARQHLAGVHRGLDR